MNAATSRIHASPGTTPSLKQRALLAPPLLADEGPVAAGRYPRGLLAAYGSSSAGLKTAILAFRALWRKYVPPLPSRINAGFKFIASPRRAS
eukprot:CAMPEP_0113445774 /NCGR_PEP_ID=MMETSP0014_2-20120614/3361_1 /TAXON_ID=2857 /ORGANISM="Nitzschia sp." /LENGTH=91 /DNA_ID=CAMNT_0000336839 /DNA_START=25 /DNA_END=300 /DNA_ORIENTATION=- /assembly_acc=CAM_ASM_000159